MDGTALIIPGTRVGMSRGMWAGTVHGIPLAGTGLTTLATIARGFMDGAPIIAGTTIGVGHTTIATGDGTVTVITMSIMATTATAMIAATSQAVVLDNVQDLQPTAIPAAVLMAPATATTSHREPAQATVPLASAHRAPAVAADMPPTAAVATWALAATVA